MVSGSRDETVRVWDAATGKEVQKLEGHSDGVRSVAFSPVRGAERAPGSCGRGGRGRCGTCVFMLVGWDTWAGAGVVAFARGLRRRVCVCMHAVGGAGAGAGAGCGMCVVVTTARVLVLCACVRSVRALVWRRRACEAYGAGVFCVVARAGCSVLLRRGCGGASGEVGLVCVLCVQPLGW